jgi:Transposase DDE domain
MAICDRHGLPVAVHLASASPYEPHLVPATLDARFLADLPTRLIGDRDYDSDALDERLMTQYGIEMIAAHRRGRRSTQDGRPLRRARRRWKIERLFAWLHNSIVSSRAGNVMSTTSWACCISRAPESSSGIYEMTSSLPACRGSVESRGRCSSLKVLFNQAGARCRSLSGFRTT